MAKYIDAANGTYALFSQMGLAIHPSEDRQLPNEPSESRIKTTSDSIILFIESRKNNFSCDPNYIWRQPGPHEA